MKEPGVKRVAGSVREGAARGALLRLVAFLLVVAFVLGIRSDGWWVSIGDAVTDAAVVAVLLAVLYTAGRLLDGLIRRFTSR